MRGRQTHIRPDRTPADRPPESGGHGPVPSAPMLRMQRVAGNRAAAAVARHALQRLTDEDLAEIRADKAQKKELERIQKNYNANFQTGAHSNYHGKETWHYWVEKAYSLKDLDTRITALIRAAEDYKARPVAPAPQPSQGPPKLSGGPSPSISSPVVSSPPASPSSAAPAPQQTKKKKNKEFTEYDPTAFPAPQKAWGPGMNPLPSSPAAYKPKPLSFVVDALNADVADLIKHKPSGAVRVLGTYWMTDDTIYFPLTVTEPPTTPEGLSQPTQRVWELEIHYHPVPTTSNYLHVKMRAGTSAQNVLPNGNWLVDPAVFQAAVTDWNGQHPDRKSAHTW
jgi:hypothetical protein